MADSVKHLTWVEVDLGAIARNYQHLKAIVGEGPDLMAVVKANAYGHGLLPVARTVVAAGAPVLGVAAVEEALALRSDGISVPVMVLGPVLPERVPEVVAHDITLVAYDLEIARAVSARAVDSGGRVRVHVKVDTGLGRLSVTPDHALSFVRALSALPGLSLEGIYTHLADAEGLDQSTTIKQFVNFRRVVSEIESAGIRLPVKHVAGSAAAMLMPDLRYGLVRAGIALYGLWPSEETRLLMISRTQDLSNLLADEEVQARGVKLLASFLEPALRFKTRVAQVKEVPAGWSIGYGCTYETRRPTTVAVLPVGYCDGFDRHLSNNGDVLIQGQRAPIVGRVAMNLTIVDVTDVPGVAADDEVVLIGRQGTQEITAEEMADRVGTINYEIVTRIRWDLPRIYAT